MGFYKRSKWDGGFTMRRVHKIFWFKKTMQYEFVAERYNPVDNREKFDIITKDYWRIKARFERFDFWKYVWCYVELKITRKVPKPRWWFEMKEFIFNWNSLHIGKEDFMKIPNYEAMAKRWNTSVFLYIYKDFGIMPLENYKHFYL